MQINLCKPGGLLMMDRRPYPSDLTDEEWTLLKPLIPPAKPGGRPRRWEMREILNAIFYVMLCAAERPCLADAPS